MSDPARFIPILYDPTVAEACLTFGHIFRRARGMYMSRPEGRMAEVLRNWPARDVRFVCVSTGGRILGLGDIGANGMGIPIGKLQLYTACAAVPPEGLLPVLLDIGTTNDALRADPLYLGLRQPRQRAEGRPDRSTSSPRGAGGVPGLLHPLRGLEGHRRHPAAGPVPGPGPLLQRRHPGHRGVALAGLLSALRSPRRLSDQRVLFFGAGSAGIGIADMIVRPCPRRAVEDDARARISMFDVSGLLEPAGPTCRRRRRSTPTRARRPPTWSRPSRRCEPTVLIGVSTKGGAFTHAVVEAMAAPNQRPIIFALSNPTDKAECTAEQAYSWSQGRALYAAGVQFPRRPARRKTVSPGQANNFYIFPAIGLAIYATRPRGSPTTVHRRRPGHRRPGDPGRPTPACCTRRRPHPGDRGYHRGPGREFIFDRAWPGWSVPPTSAPSIEGQLYTPGYRNTVLSTTTRREPFHR